MSNRGVRAVIDTIKVAGLAPMRRNSLQNLQLKITLLAENRTDFKSPREKKGAQRRERVATRLLLLRQPYTSRVVGSLTLVVG